jgi:hypothetical protein
MSCPCVATGHPAPKNQKTGTLVFRYTIVLFGLPEKIFIPTAAGALTA